MPESERLNCTSGRSTGSRSCRVRLVKQGCLEALAAAGGSLGSAVSLRLLPAAGARSSTMLEMLRLESDFAKQPLLDAADWPEVHEAIWVNSWASAREASILAAKRKGSAAVRYQLRDRLCERLEQAAVGVREMRAL